MFCAREGSCEAVNYWLSFFRKCAEFVPTHPVMLPRSTPAEPTHRGQPEEGCSDSNWAGRAADCRLRPHQKVLGTWGRWPINPETKGLLDQQPCCVRSGARLRESWFYEGVGHVPVVVVPLAQEAYSSPRRRRRDGARMRRRRDGAWMPCTHVDRGVPVGAAHGPIAA